MKKSTLLLFSLLLFTVSCNKSEVFNQFDEGFPDNRWEAKDAKTFEFAIDNDSKLYNITFRFSHIFNYQFASVPLRFTIVNPAGEQEERTIDLQLKDSNGKELAECSVDYCDLNYRLEENVKLQKGNYKVIVANAFEGPYLPNIIGVGLKVEMVK